LQSQHRKNNLGGVIELGLSLCVCARVCTASATPTGMREFKRHNALSE
jgi:hypothetical protein